MTDDLRSLLVDLQDAWDEMSDDDRRLKGLFERLRSELLADAAGRDALARARAVGPPLSIPTEPLFLTPQFSALTRSQWRLYGAIHIAAHHFGGMTALMASAQHAEIAAKAVKLSDRIIRVNDEFDRTPPAQPAAVAVTGGPHSAEAVKAVPAAVASGADCRAYLRHLSEVGSVNSTFVPPGVDPKALWDIQYTLMKAGHLTFTPFGFASGSVVEITAAGKDAVEAAAAKASDKAA